METVEITSTKVGFVCVMDSVNPESLPERHDISEERGEGQQRFVRRRRPILLLERQDSLERRTAEGVPTGRGGWISAASLDKAAQISIGQKSLKFGPATSGRRAIRVHDLQLKLYLCDSRSPRRHY